MLTNYMPSEEGFQNYDFFVCLSLQIWMTFALEECWVLSKMLKNSFIHTQAHTTLGVFKSSCSPLKCVFKLTFDPTQTGLTLPHTGSY